MQKYEQVHNNASKDTAINSSKLEEIKGLSDLKTKIGN